MHLFDSTQLSLFDSTTSFLASEVNRSYLAPGVASTPKDIWGIFIPEVKQFLRPECIYFQKYFDELKDLNIIPGFDPKQLGYPFSFFTYLTGNRYETGIYLSDELSRKLQLFINHWYDHDVFYRIQFQVFYVLYFFEMILSFRMFMFWFLMFNIYQAPFSFIPYMTTWFIRIGNSMCPAILGVAMGPSIANFILSLIIDVVHRLVLTFPYLPSEGITYAPPRVIENARSMGVNPEDLQIVPYSAAKGNKELMKFLEQENEVIRVYTGTPKIYTEEPIPNWLREYWWTKEPQVTRHFAETKMDLINEKNIRVLPNRIEEKIRRTGVSVKWPKGSDIEIYDK